MNGGSAIDAAEKGKQIPPLRCGMEMQKATASTTQIPFGNDKQESKSNSKDNSNSNSRFLRCATEWKCKESGC